MRLNTWGVCGVMLVCLGVSACSQQTVKSEDCADGDLLVGKSSDCKPQPKQKTRQKQTVKNNKKPAINVPRHTSSRIPQISDAELSLIAEKIFRNEGGGDVDKLVHWNDGEDFASMGVGHFTWYPAGRAARFGNTFPDMLGHLQTCGVQMPGWLQQARYTGAPWHSKSELMVAKSTGQVQDLQNMLYQTRELQAEYIVERAQRAMPQLVGAAPVSMRAQVGQNLNAVANTPGGWYVLVDYINFKGEGMNCNAGYKGQNWGLLQVLEEMSPSNPGQQALNEFADAAGRVLARRVRNSPPERNEARWLAGWSNRLNTYRNPDV